MRRTVVLCGLIMCAMPAMLRAQDAASVFPLRPSMDGVASAAPVVAAPLGDTASANKPQAVEHSDAYYTRLTIHRYGSYIELPLFASEYYLGNKLIKGTTSTWVKPTHKAVAFTLGALFVSNTVTGVWNLVESRHDKEGRGRRLLHAGLMLASDAGFAYTGSLAHASSHGTPDDKNKHRNAALISMGFATGGTLVMWLR